MIFFIILIGAIVFLLALYLFFFVKRIISLFTDRKGLARLLSALILLILGGTSIYFFRLTSIMIMLHLVVISSICQGVSYILKKAVKNISFQKKRDIIYRTGIVPVILTTIVGILGYCNMTNVKRTEYTCYTSKIQNGEEIKVAMISDLHMGTVMNTNTLRGHMEKISKENPDVFLLVGDIVDEGTTKEEMIKTFDILSNVKTKRGIYYVYGNHDRNIYGNHKYFTDEELTQTIVDSGITVLKDDVKEFDNFVIMGRDDYSSELNGNNREDIYSLIEKTDSSKYIITIDHQPKELEKSADAGVDLELFGHTHGGQIWPAGIIAEKAGIFELSYGKREIGEYTAITSSGIASWGYPIRTEQHSEYVIINVIPNE